MRRQKNRGKLVDLHREAANYVVFLRIFLLRASYNNFWVQNQKDAQYKNKARDAIELKAATDMVKKEITSGHIPRKAAFEVHACAVWTWSEGKHAGIINELYL